MEQRALEALEFPKVLQHLASFAVSEAGHNACLALRPFATLVQVEQEGAVFEQGRLWVERSETRLASFLPLDGLLVQARIPHTILDTDALWALRQALNQARDFMASISQGEGSTQWPLWTERCRTLPTPVKTGSALSRCLADDGTLRDGASPELSLVRGELRRLHQQCTRKVKDYAEEYGVTHYLQDAYMTLASDRYVLPLKSNFKGRLQGVIHDYSQTGETCYFEPMFLVSINNRLQELKREEREEERKVLLYITSLVREELPGIQASYAFLVDLDVLSARCALGKCYDGRLPAFAAERGVCLRDARHPLLALAAFEQARAAKKQGMDKPRVVSSTLELLPGQQALVISGGNAGGKTVCLKTLGLTAVMALCALPVPVGPGSYIPFWGAIHAFIGDAQSIEDHLSTYTAQIAHLSRIWSGLDAASLVILDEFGAGTDPSQGAALAQAVVDSLVERGAYVAAATHFPALKAYALSAHGVRAASVLFDPTTKKPLFRLVYDQVGSSQALDVAREHGLAEDVLRRAEQYLLLGGEDTSALVERLNALAVAREAELGQLDKEKAAFRDKRARLEERFAKEKQDLFADLQTQAKAVLIEWKQQRVSHKHALKELSRLRTSLNAPLAGQGGGEAAPPLALEGLVLGQRVTHVPWKRTGTVLEVDNRKNRVRLNLDGVSLWAGGADLCLLQEDKKKHAAQGYGGGIKNSVPIVPLRLDLRGMRADVAISELAKCLDSAIVSGRESVEVIHGRGTGVLRRELHGFLKTFPAVASFALAPEDQGGDGMTCVVLK